jgi:hypothetical protein
MDVLPFCLLNGLFLNFNHLENEHTSGHMSQAVCASQSASRNRDVLLLRDEQTHSEQMKAKTAAIELHV